MFTFYELAVCTNALLVVLVVCMNFLYSFYILASSCMY